MLVSKMYRLVLVKYQLKIAKVEIWLNQYLTDIMDTNLPDPPFIGTHPLTYLAPLFQIFVSCPLFSVTLPFKVF